MPIKQKNKKTKKQKNKKTEEQGAGEIIEQEEDKFEEGDHGKIFAQWTFPEFTRHNRGLLWYILMGALSIGLLIYSLATLNYLFALIIVLAVFILFLSTRKTPLDIDFKITEDGLELSNDFYDYKDINKFWIIYEPPEVKNLYISFKTSFRQDLRIPLFDHNPLEIRKHLLKYIDEDLTKDDEPLSDFWERKFKL